MPVTVVDGSGASRDAHRKRRARRKRGRAAALLMGNGGQRRSVPYLEPLLATAARAVAAAQVAPPAVRLAALPSMRAIPGAESGDPRQPLAHS